MARNPRSKAASAHRDGLGGGRLRPARRYALGVKLRRRDVIAALILVLMLGSLVVALVFGAIPR